MSKVLYIMIVITSYSIHYTKLYDLGFALFVFAISIFIVKRVMGWGKDELTEDDVK